MDERQLFGPCIQQTSLIANRAVIQDLLNPSEWNKKELKLGGAFTEIRQKEMRRLLEGEMTHEERRGSLATALNVARLLRQKGKPGDGEGNNGGGEGADPNALSPKDADAKTARVVKDMLRRRYAKQHAERQRKQAMMEDRPSMQNLWWQDMSRPTMLFMHRIHTEYFKPDDQKKREAEARERRSQFANQTPKRPEKQQREDEEEAATLSADQARQEFLEVLTAMIKQ